MELNFSASFSIFMSWMICGLSVMWNASYIRRSNLWAWIDLHGQAVSSFRECSSFLCCWPKASSGGKYWFQPTGYDPSLREVKGVNLKQKPGKSAAFLTGQLMHILTNLRATCLGMLQPTVDLALSISQQPRQPHTDKRMNQSHLDNPSTETPQVILECDKLTVNTN